MKKMLTILFPPFLLLMLFSCSNKATENKVWMIIQPQLELNRTTKAQIFFAGKPEPGSIKIIHLEKNDDYDLDPRQIEQQLASDSTNFYYNIEFTAGRLGKATLPVIEAVIDGKTYKTAETSVDVVQKQPVDSSSVKLVLSTDKAAYQMNDTISLSLHEYSRFSQRTRFTPADLVKNGAPEALFAVIEEGNVDYKVGIVGFKGYIDANFNASNFSWNVNDIGRHMENLNNGTYIKTEIFSMKLVAKKSGKFKIGSSRFNYKIYPYSEAFKEELLSKKDFLRTNNRIDVKSNVIEFLVK